MIMEQTIWHLAFWKSTFERAVKTAAQAGLAYLPPAFTIIGFDWRALGGLMAGGAVASLLMSLIGNAATKTGPSWGSPEEVPPPAPEPQRADLPPAA